MSTPLSHTAEALELDAATEALIAAGRSVRELGGAAYTRAVREEHWEDMQGTQVGMKPESTFPGADNETLPQENTPSTEPPAPREVRGHIVSETPMDPAPSIRPAIGSRAKRPDTAPDPTELSVPHPEREYGHQGRSAAGARALYQSDHARKWR